MKRILLVAPLLAIFIVSCVSPRMYDELKAKKEECDKQNEELKAKNLALTTRDIELAASAEELQSQVKALSADTARMGVELRELQSKYTSLNDTYQGLLKDGPNSASNSEATKKLIRDLQKTQENLQKREDELRLKEAALKTKKESLDAMSSELQQKNRRLAELEQILASKDSSVKALKNTVSNALIGFKDKGLTVEMKNGKVYVMLEERLLFATGSIIVDPKGVDALKELGKVLEKNQDINVLIEGHTDNVPMRGAGDIKDNWDLSAMRATSVVKIVLSNPKVVPSRLTAAGRSEFAPIDKSNSVDGRKKNRRIEVILTPKLDEIFKVLETN